MSITAKAIEGLVFEESKNTIHVTATRISQTDICIKPSFESAIASTLRPGSLFVIDEQVAERHRNALGPAMAMSPYIMIASGESSKSWENLRSIIDKASSSHIPRTGTLVAVGGGVVSDIAGLAANLYFRGIRVTHVPTTLLSMVDAAIGGKVAVDHPYQKNMIGSFYHPSETYIAVDVLKTVDRRHLISAAGEIIKLAILSPTSLFAHLEAASRTWYEDELFLESIVRLSVKEKLRMLGSNCFERNLKRVLNLGHTVAHPLEDISDFRILHGEAVAFGVLIASNIAKQRCLLADADYHRICNVTERLGLTVPDEPYDTDELWERIRRLIHQRGGKSLHYVLPTGIGKQAAIVDDISLDEFMNAYNELTSMKGKQYATTY